MCTPRRRSSRREVITNPAAAAADAAAAAHITYLLYAVHVILYIASILYSRIQCVEQRVSSRLIHLLRLFFLSYYNIIGYRTY